MDLDTPKARSKGSDTSSLSMILSGFRGDLLSCSWNIFELDCAWSVLQLHIAGVNHHTIVDNHGEHPNPWTLKSCKHKRYMNSVYSCEAWARPPTFPTCENLDSPRQRR